LSLFSILLNESKKKIFVVNNTFLTFRFKNILQVSGFRYIELFPQIIKGLILINLDFKRFFNNKIRFILLLLFIPDAVPYGFIRKIIYLVIQGNPLGKKSVIFLRLNRALPAFIPVIPFLILFTFFSFDSVYSDVLTFILLA